jgi:hypothetical protein
MEFQSLRKAGIAKTPRVADGAGAAGVGRLAGMELVYLFCDSEQSTNLQLSKQKFSN